MEIISFRFFLFTLIVILIYSRLTVRAQNIWLLVASYGFYFTWGARYAAVLLVMTLFNYWIGLHLGSTYSRLWLRFGVLINALSLVVLKLLSSSYGLWFFETVHWKWVARNLTSVLLPIGFSFYILQAISYLVDVSRKQIDPESDLVNLALYLAFFPKLLSGPLERAGHFIPQLRRERRVDNRQFGKGMGLILVGLLRKLIVADGLAAIRPSDIFSQPAGYSIIEHIVWLVVFAFVLYNDFAGYTSIVRGISALMGFELTANFSQPFFANSFSDFWNRWHISLSAWLRDYIFFPVRRWSMKKRFPNWVTLVVPPMITMVASGYWHGATFSMLAWGGLHGIYQVVDQKFRKTASLSSATRQGFSIALVFIFVTIAWIPFAAISFLDAVAYMRVFLPPYGLEFPTPVLINLIAALSISLALDLKEYKASSELYFLDWSPSFQAWAVSFALLILLLFAGGGPDISNFIYQGF